MKSRKFIKVTTIFGSFLVLIFLILSAFLFSAKTSFFNGGNEHQSTNKSSAPQNAQDQSKSKDKLFINNKFPYSNNNGSDEQIDGVLPTISSLNKGDVVSTTMANLGFIKSLRINKFFRNVSGREVAPTFISQISLVAPDGTYIPYKINPLNSSTFSTIQDVVPGNLGVNETYLQIEKFLQDDDWSGSEKGKSIELDTTTLSLAIELISPQVIGHIEINGDVTRVGDISVVDAYNNVWSSQSDNKRNDLYYLSSNSDPKIGQAKVENAWTTLHNSRIVGPTEPIGNFYLSNRTYNGRAHFGEVPGVQLTWKQAYGYGRDPIYSIPYTNSQNAISLFYKGNISLENALNNSAEKFLNFNESDFSLGKVRLDNNGANYWVYSLTSETDFNLFASLMKDKKNTEVTAVINHLKTLFSQKLIIRRSVSPIFLSDSSFNSDVTSIVNYSLPLTSPVSGLKNPFESEKAVSGWIQKAMLFETMDEADLNKAEYLKSNYNVYFRYETGFKTSGQNSVWTDWHEFDLSDSNQRVWIAKDNLHYNSTNGLEIIINTKIETKKSFSSFGHSYDYKTYQLVSRSNISVEPEVTVADFSFNQTVTSFGMESMGDISEIVINFVPKPIKEISKSYFSLFSELYIYDQNGNKIDYQVSEYTETQPGITTGATIDDWSLPNQDLWIIKEFLTDGKQTLDSTLKKIIDSGRISTDRLAYQYGNDGVNLILKRDDYDTTGLFNQILLLNYWQSRIATQRMKIKLLQPQKINHVGYYFASANRPDFNISFKTAEGATYRTEKPVRLTNNGQDADVYWASLEQSKTYYDAENSDTIMIDGNNDYIRKVLPIDKGTINFGNAAVQKWKTPDIFYDNLNKVTQSSLIELGPITAGRVALKSPSYVTTYSNPNTRYNFKSLIIYDEKNEVLPWTIPYEEIKGGQSPYITKNHNADFTSDSNKGRIDPSAGVFSSYTNAANFARDAQNPSHGFFTWNIDYRDYYPQPELASDNTAIFNFVFSDGLPHKISRIEYRGTEDHKENTRISLSLFSSEAYEYQLSKFNELTSRDIEYWEGDKLVIGKSPIEWRFNAFNLANTSLFYDDNISYYFSRAWDNNWKSAVRYSTQDYVFEVFSKKLNLWVRLESYHFEGTTKNDLTLQIRYRRSDGAAFYDGTFLRTKELDFSFLVFQPKKVSIRTINVDPTNMRYTHADGSGTIENLVVVAPSDVNIAYNVQKLSGRNYTQDTIPTDLENEDIVKVIFSLPSGSQFIDPQNPNDTREEKWTRHEVTLPKINGLKKSTIIDFSPQLIGWYESDEKINMKFVGKDFNGKIATQTMENLKSLQDKMPSTRIYIRYIQDGIQVEIPINDSISLEAIGLANTNRLFVVLKIIDGNLISYQQSIGQEELILNSYTINNLELPNFVFYPDKNYANGYYKENLIDKQFTLVSNIEVNANWQLLITTKNLSTNVEKTYTTFPQQIEENTSLTLQITPKINYAFGNANTYTSSPHIFKRTFYFANVNSSSPENSLARKVLYSEEILPKAFVGFFGVTKIVDYLGSLSIEVSQLLEEFVASGLNVQIFVNNEIALRNDATTWSSFKIKINNGDRVRMDLFPRGGYSWFNPFTRIKDDAILSREYIASGLINITNAEIPKFNNALSGYDNGNFFATGQKNSKGEASQGTIFANNNSFIDESFLMVYLPNGVIPSEFKFDSLQKYNKKLLPDFPGTLDEMVSTQDLKNNSKVLFMLRSLLAPEKTSTTTFYNGAKFVLKIVSITNLPTQVAISQFPPSDRQDLISDANLFTGITSSNKFGEFLDKGIISSFAKDASFSLFANATSTTPISTWGLNALPIVGAPFVKDQVMKVTITRDEKKIWWDFERKNSPQQVTFQYVVPSFKEVSLKVHTNDYSRFANSTVTFSGLNNDAKITLNLNDNFPTDPSGTDSSYGSVLVQFVAFKDEQKKEIIFSKTTAFKKEVLTTKSLVISAQSPIANDMTYEIRIIPKSGFELYDFNTLRDHTNNPWKIATQKNKVSGLLESIFEKASLVRPIKVDFNGVSKFKNTISNLFDETFLPSTFGKFEIYFNSVFADSKTSQPQKYDPINVNHFFTNGETIKLVLIPNHSKYLVDPLKIHTDPLTGDVIGDDDDVYEQITEVSGIDEAIFLDDVLGQIKDSLMETTNIENGMFVKIANENYTNLTSSKMSNSFNINLKIDFTASIITLSNDGEITDINKITYEQLKDGVWFSKILNITDPAKNIYFYNNNSVVRIELTTKLGYALTKRTIKTTPPSTTYEILQNNVYQVQEIKLPEIFNGLNSSGFETTLYQDSVFNTANDFRIDLKTQMLPGYIAQAIYDDNVIWNFTINEETTPIVFAQSPTSGRDQTYFIKYLNVNAPKLTPQGKLQLDSFGRLATPIEKVTFTLKDIVKVISKVTLKIKFKEELKIQIYEVKNHASNSFLTFPKKLDAVERTINTTTFTIISIPSSWNNISTLYDQKAFTLDKDKSYEKSITFIVDQMTSLIVYDANNYLYNLKVYSAEGALVNTYKDIFKLDLRTPGQPVPIQNKKLALLTALSEINSNELIIGNQIIISAETIDKDKTFDVASIPTTIPPGFSFTKNTWTIAKLVLVSPDVKKIVNVPTDFDSSFNSNSISGVEGKPTFVGFEIFKFVTAKMQILMALTNDKNVDIVTPAAPKNVEQILEKLQEWSAFIRNGVFLTITITPSADEVLLENKLPYFTNSPLIKKVEIKKVFAAIPFKTLSKDDLTYTYVGENDDVKVEIRNWENIFGPTANIDKTRVLFNVKHFRRIAGVDTTLHTSPIDMNLLAFENYLATTLGTALQVPATNKLSLNDTINIAIKPAAGYVFSDLKIEKAYTYVFVDEFTVKKKIFIKRIVESYTKITIADGTMQSISGISTFALPETIAQLNAKGVIVKFDLAGKILPINTLPTSLVNSDRLSITLVPTNNVTTNLVIEGTEEVFAIYQKSFRVKGLLTPIQLSIPQKLNIKGKLNTQASVDLDWITPANLFVVTTSVKDSENDVAIVSSTRVSDLRNGQIVDISVEAVKEQIINRNGVYTLKIVLPTFVVSGLKNFVEKPNFEKTLLLIVDKKTSVVSYEGTINSNAIQLTYSITYASNSIQEFNSLTSSNLKEASKIKIKVQALQDYVFDELLTTSFASQTYDFDSSFAELPIIDLSKIFAMENLSKTGNLYNLPTTINLPVNITLKYSVDGGEYSEIAPLDIDIKKSTSIAISAANNAAAAVVSKEYLISSADPNNFLSVPNISNSDLVNLYGAEKNAKVVFSKNLTDFVENTNVLTKLIVKRNGKEIFAGKTEQNFNYQLEKINNLIENSDTIEITFTPIKDKYFANLEDTAQTLVKDFNVVGLASSDASTINVVAIAVSVGVISVIIVSTSIAYVFMRRIAR